jgi:hypothetical protein
LPTPTLTDPPPPAPAAAAGMRQCAGAMLYAGEDARKKQNQFGLMNSQGFLQDEVFRYWEKYFSDAGKWGSNIWGPALDLNSTFKMQMMWIFNVPSVVIGLKSIPIEKLLESYNALNDVIYRRTNNNNDPVGSSRYKEHLETIKIIQNTKDFIFSWMWRRKVEDSSVPINLSEAQAAIHYIQMAIDRENLECATITDQDPNTRWGKKRMRLKDLISDLTSALVIINERITPPPHLPSSLDA